MTNPKRLPKPNVSGCGPGNHAHGSGSGHQGSFEFKLTGPAVWLLAGGVAALLYQVAARLGGGG
ncbi:hypothetical protein WMF26_36120 [Sorangium sp. So ce185]|uniref:hypothetical protein n=1 Tax=Sorangium sp. So ce185 TaxID=3133287 RepID=UPI003F63BBFB